MSATRLSIELHNRGIKIKEWLKHANYDNDAAVIDDFLCHYDYINIYDKQELTTSILRTFNTRRCSELFISDIAIEGIKDFCNLIEKMRTKLDEEISTISFDRFIYNDNEYIFMRDVFNWIINSKLIVVLLKENGKYFNDNLVALDHSGKVLWSSCNCIDCQNRLGAFFVGLNELSGDTICVNAYIGINYMLNAITGEVCEKNIVK